MLLGVETKAVKPVLNLDTSIYMLNAWKTTKLLLKTNANLKFIMHCLAHKVMKENNIWKELDGTASNKDKTSKAAPPLLIIYIIIDWIPSKSTFKLNQYRQNVRTNFMKHTSKHE